jgi:hypothetical protein
MKKLNFPTWPTSKSCSSLRERLFSLPVWELAFHFHCNFSLFIGESLEREKEREKRPQELSIRLFFELPFLKVYIS